MRWKPMPSPSAADKIVARVEMKFEESTSKQKLDEAIASEKKLHWEKVASEVYGEIFRLSEKLTQLFAMKNDITHWILALWGIGTLDADLQEINDLINEVCAWIRFRLMTSFAKYYRTVFRESWIINWLDNDQFRKISFLENWWTAYQSCNEAWLIKVNYPEPRIILKKKHISTFIDIRAKKPLDLLKWTMEFWHIRKQITMNHYTDLDRDFVNSDWLGVNEDSNK